MTQFLKKNIKYISVIIFILLAMFFGERVDDNKIDACAGLLRSQRFMLLNSDSNTGAVTNLFLSKKDDYYRIIFKAKADNLDQSKSDEILSSSINLNITSVLDNKVTVKNLDLPEDGVYHFYEVNFKSPEDLYNGLEFELLLKKNAESVTVDKNIQIMRLNVSNEADLRQLKATQFGITDINNTSASQQDFDKIIYAFKSRNKTLVQTFKSDQDNLVSVDLRLHFLGNGGYGKYHLGLREISGDNHTNFSLGSKELASLEFTSDVAESEYQSNPANEIYTFPLASKLDKGKRYAIVLDNKAVTSNLLQHLRVYGTDKKNNDQPALSGTNGNFKNLGQTYFKVHYAKLFQYSGYSMLTDATVQDLGGGQGLFSYSMLVNPQAVSDFSEINLTGKDDKFFYDKNTNALLVSATKDDYILMAVNTVYPFKKIHVSGKELVGTNYETNVEYSLDKQTWSPVNFTSSSNFDLTFVNSDLGRKTIYLRFSPNLSDYRPFPYFGIKELKVGAEILL